MNAVISGTARTALLIDGESLESFHVDNPSKRVKRQQSDLPYLFGEARDLRVIKGTNLISILTELKSESDLRLALDLTLICLDQELEENIRSDAILSLDEVLRDERLREHLENVLYARPLPDDGDLPGALAFCSSTAGARRARAFLRRFARHLTVIEEVNAAWDLIPTEMFGGYEDRTRFQQTAVREGLFRVVVFEMYRFDLTRQSISVKTRTRRESRRFCLNPSIASLENHLEVLQRWIEPLFKRRADRERSWRTLEKSKGDHSRLLSRLLKISQLIEHGGGHAGRKALGIHQDMPRQVGPESKLRDRTKRNRASQNSKDDRVSTKPH